MTPFGSARRARSSGTVKPLHKRVDRIRRCLCPVDAKPSGVQDYSMPRRSSNQPTRDLNELAARIVDAATSDDPQAERPRPPEKNPHAAALGRLGGKKGGAARAAKLSPEERRAIAQKA